MARQKVRSCSTRDTSNNSLNSLPFSMPKQGTAPWSCLKWLTSDETATDFLQPSWRHVKGRLDMVVALTDRSILNDFGVKPSPWLFSSWEPYRFSVVAFTLWLLNLSSKWNTFFVLYLYGLPMPGFIFNFFKNSEFTSLFSNFPAYLQIKQQPPPSMLPKKVSLDSFKGTEGDRSLCGCLTTIQSLQLPEALQAVLVPVGAVVNGSRLWDLAAKIAPISCVQVGHFFARPAVSYKKFCFTH